MTEAHVETHTFKTEARQFLELMIHSLYSSKDVFLRELISNASDALDKRRFEAITNVDLLPEGTELEIQVYADPAERTLTIADNGIGMAREDLIRELGTIARSGTKEFAEKLAEAKAEGQMDSLIGQFGVGFYSAFIAADHVEVTSRRAGSDDKGARFISKGDGTFTIADAPRDEVGTTIVLHLRDAEPDNNLKDFTDDWELRTTIKKYSDFIQYPVRLKTLRQEPALDEDGQAIEGAVPELVTEWVTANSMKAIWTRPKSEVEEEEYVEFYRHVSHDWTAPLETIALKAEGTFEYYALLFIPGQPPFDLHYRDARYGLQLHVNRVLILEETKDLLPDYLRFVKGVVDSPDLSLNISREILQKDRRVGSIKKRLTKRVLDTLSTMRDDSPEKFATFWDAFGRVLKEGVVTDADNRDRIRDLLWFQSSSTTPITTDRDDTETPDTTNHYTTLAAYIERMKEEQDAIYYVTGDSRETVEKSPHLEAFIERGYEVLYLVDAYDEIMLTTLNDVDGTPLKSVGKGAVELGSDEEREQAKAELEEKVESHKSLLDFLQAQLEEHIKEVRLSHRLTTSAACLVGEEGDYSPHFKRLLERSGHSSVPDVKRILELNPSHSLIGGMLTRYEADPKDGLLVDYAQLIYGQALLAEGATLPDPVDFSRRLATLMTTSL